MSRYNTPYNRERTERRLKLPLFISVDRTVVGYLAAVSKEDPRMVCSRLRDMSNTAIERFIKKAKSWTTCKIEYPGTKVVLQARCSEEHDRAALMKDYNAWIKQFYDLHNLEPNQHGHYNAHWSHPEWNNWNQKNSATNPDHHQNRSKYAMIEVHFEQPQANLLKISQDEIDTYLMEDILMGGAEVADGESTHRSE